jgi:2,4-didehydro-3-deoxy-L-rhamnonate hydrolase
MKLLRFGEKGKERPGLLRDKNIVDLREIFPDIPDIGRSFFEDNWLHKIAGVDAPGKIMEVRLGPPVLAPSKIICVGKNYAEHAREGGFEAPDSPLIFCKTPNTVTGPFDPIVMPASSGKVDWEVELAVVMGRAGKGIKRVDANDYIAGYTVMNDVSGREAQFSDSQWYRGKSFDTFAPMGPVLITPDEIADVTHLNLTTRVDGKIMQSGNTRDMVFDIPTLIENISADITLLPGDIISTGTPSGVGIFMDPPVVLEVGNVVECHVEGIGSIINRVVANPD